MRTTKQTKEIIQAKGIDISIYLDGPEEEYISLTDIARYKSKNPNSVVANWIRNMDTLEFLGLW
ncbi:MAG: KilA-N domain-containing protein [Micrococcaceae bacterium]